MLPLSELEEIIGFFSYARGDDAGSQTLSTLRRRIQDELRGLLGRSEKSLRLFQDAEAIPSGSLWESEINGAIGQSVFFVPIITPRVVRSPHCAEEFQKFLARERELGRDDLVFPIIYIEVPELEDDALWRVHPFLKDVGVRQFVDWTDLRFDLESPAARREVALFCRTIASRLRKRFIAPEKDFEAAKTTPNASVAAPPTALLDEPRADSTSAMPLDVTSLQAPPQQAEPASEEPTPSRRRRTPIQAADALFIAAFLLSQPLRQGVRINDIDALTAIPGFFGLVQLLWPLNSRVTRCFLQFAFGSVFTFILIDKISEAVDQATWSTLFLLYVLMTLYAVATGLSVLTYSELKRR